MKKSILLATAISVFSITATYAQDTQAPPPPPKEQKDGKDHKRGPGGGMRMYEDLNLSQDQKDKIKAIDDEQMPKMKALRDDSSLSDDDKKSKMMELRKSRKEKIDQILTPDQKTKLDEKMKKMKEERKDAPKPDNQ